MTSLFLHEHRPDFTAANVYKGLFAFTRIFDEDDTGDETRGWRLPSGQFDIPLVVYDTRFDPNDGQLFFDQFTTDGFLGDKLTVNGKIQPFLEVKRRKYRFRILNPGPSRFYIFVLRRNGRSESFAQITDGGNFLQAPRTVSRLETWVAERHDVIIDFRRFQAGDRLRLANILPMREDGRGGDHDHRLNPDDPVNQALEFRVVGGNVADPSRVPSSFRPFPPVDLNESVRRRVWRFDRRNGLWTVNGELFDPDIDHRAGRLANPINQVRRNTSEVWVFENSSNGWEHPVHAHLEEGQAIRIDGVPLAAANAARRDVQRLGRAAHEVEVFMRFRDFPDPDFTAPSPGEAGRYVLHCHNTVHEDHAMMVTFNMVP